MTSEALANRPSGQPGEMTLMEHLLELRNRVIVSAIAVVICGLVCFFFWETILGWLLAPGRAQTPNLKVASFSPVDRIGVIFQIGLFGGVALASPVIIYEVLSFVVPGLNNRERRLLFPAIFGTVFFLLCGIAFGYYIVLPLSLGFLLNFGSDKIENVIGIKEYVKFVIRSVFWSGMAFELPMVMALLGWLGLVKARQMLDFWRYAIVLVFILACFVVPTPDPIDQTIVAVPLLGLFFLGIGFAWMLQPSRRQKADKPA